MIQRFFLSVLVFFCFATAAFSQTTFSLNFSPVTLPGGHSSVVGSESGVALTVTPNFDLKEINVVGSGLQFYGGGFNYRLPVLSTMLNNTSSTLNGLKFQFYLTGEAGNVQTPSGPSSGHFGVMAGGGVNYLLSGTWALGAEVQYAKFPGYANNTFTVAVGPKINF